jgi:UDP-N-acetylmuramoyl-tripeptide--D-alanyl-D-alanine ligase
MAVTIHERYTLQTLLDDLGLREPLPGAEGVAFSGVAIDSRAVRGGELFVALPGERTDGHAYVEDAFRAGALAALVGRPTSGRPVVDPSSGARPAAWQPPVEVCVPDPLVALQHAARARRLAHPHLTVVGVTGSVGKTTTKEAVAAVLAQGGETLYSSGNRNNEIGLPLTLLGLGPAHRYAVLEMGMYALGEIAALCEIARPTVGVVTNVGPVHLERLGTLERIAAAKAELLAALPAGGVAILNGDDPRVLAMPTPPGVRRLTYGRGVANDLRATRVVGEGLAGVRLAARLRAREDLGLPAGRAVFHVPTPGVHTALAALAAVGVGLIAGLGWDAIARGLAAQGAALRLAPKRTRAGATLLDDSYNASPSSMRAALDLLAELPGRRVAVLGDMLELGAHEARGHLAVGARAARVADVLVTVGPRAERIAREALRRGLAPEAVHVAAGVPEATACVARLLEEGDVLLVKGSRGVGLEALVAALVEGEA